MLSNNRLLLILIAVMQVEVVCAAENDVKHLCERIGNKLGSVSVSACLNNKLIDSGRRTDFNTPLVIKEYPPLKRRQPLGKVLMIGGIHGDEYSSVSIIFKWLNILDVYHSGLFHWKIIPLMNPDGLLRKKSQRTNGNGIDLNRNFSPGEDNLASFKYWIKRTHKDPRRYPGAQPLSEPETRWVSDLIKEFDPDVIVAVHAPYGILDFDGPKQAPDKLGPLHLKLLGTYPGSLGNYAGIQLKKPVITIELPYAGIMPSKKEVSKIWTDMVRWLRSNIKN